MKIMKNIKQIKNKINILGIILTAPLFIISGYIFKIDYDYFNTGSYLFSFISFVFSFMFFFAGRESKNLFKRRK